VRGKERGERGMEREGEGKRRVEVRGGEEGEGLIFGLEHFGLEVRSVAVCEAQLTARYDTLIHSPDIMPCAAINSMFHAVTLTHH